MVIACWEASHQVHTSDSCFHLLPSGKVFVVSGSPIAGGHVEPAAIESVCALGELELIGLCQIRNSIFVP